MAATVDPAARLALRGITKNFPGVRALDDVSLELGHGEILALCGENGAGKSTLIKVLCGCFPTGSFRGEIRLEGRPVHFRGIRAAEAHGIALIAQELALVPELSVAENLMLGREPTRFGLVRREAVRVEALRALGRVGLDLDPARPVRTLGIAQQQLVEIARALAKQAAILVLDEPTAALSGGDARRLLDLLTDLRGRGVSAIYVSHRLDEVFAIADRITVLRDGRTVATGPAREMPRERVIAHMVGRDVNDYYPRPRRGEGGVLLEVRGWALADPAGRRDGGPGRDVLEGVGFEVRAGEVLGLAGLMGAGRTALVTSLVGAARSAVRGTLRLADGPARGPFRSPAEALAAGVALLSEDRQRFGLVPAASVEDNLTLATLSRFARRGLLETGERARAARAQVETLRIRTPDLGTPVDRLSGGNQQKVVLGRWLLAEPRVLLLDEPTRGIDVGARAEIYRLIGELTARGLAVVLVSSDLPELLGLSHRVVVLNRGRIAATLDGERATPEAVMAAATRGAVA
jgi:D-xylose transport system ATP-binding protein